MFRIKPFEIKGNIQLHNNATVPELVLRRLAGDAQKSVEIVFV